MSTDIKALSIKQPWAWLIRKGYKDIENRSWKTKHRGWAFIHTGQEPDRERYDEACSMLRNYNGKEIPPIEQLNTGGIVGKMKIADCVERHVSPWWMPETDYGFVIDMAHSVPFRQCPGQLRFFEPEFEGQRYEPDLSSETPATSCDGEGRRPF